MSIFEVCKYALDYLVKCQFQGDEHEWRINGSLRWLLCEATDRIRKEFGEVTKRDVVLLVESWIIAQGSAHPKKQAIVKDNLPVNCVDETGKS